MTHENTRHTTRFTVIGNHLTQHPDLSLLAIGLACHIQSLPTGARVDIKTLADRFPEGATRIAAALRELKAHGYLRHERHRNPHDLLQPAHSCPASHHHPHPSPTSHAPTPPPEPDEVPVAPGDNHTPRKKHRKPLPAVPRPTYPAPTLLQQATDLLADPRRHDPHLLLSTCDTTHLAPGVAAWLERDVPPTADLPPEGPRRPAALLAHRLTTQLPPPTVRHPLRNCDGCDRAFRSPSPACAGHAP
ncbi:helix-turn-helix domain-containing protein [Streptomyces sp. HUAS ZL42]|uniref:helix-turn-helix domain-containing protein n=1 Tax=Streptomyces sp. HUAS ZL42 TaxID=3231715 RepID=UPI00345E1E10